MPLPGGASDKYGNRYEGKWTAYCLAQVMAEETDSICVEPPGLEGEGCEFTLRKASATEYHQVKRQHAGPGGWGIAELGQRGVLKHGFVKTQDANARFVFASTTSAGMLNELADGARRSQSLRVFKEQFLKGAKEPAWRDLLREWNPLIGQEATTVCGTPTVDWEAAQESVAYQRLQRIEIRTVDETSLIEMVETKLRSLVNADPESVRHALCALALESTHQTLHADEIWSYLAELGYRRQDYSKEPSVLAAVEALNARYGSMIKGIGRESMIPRGETQAVMGVLKGSGAKTSALVSGEAGVGKTGVLGQVIHVLRNEGIPHLYFRVDRLEPTELPQNVGSQLGLPASPAEVLAGVAKGRVCVLIIDQLDAVSWVSGRNPEFFHCIHEIIRQAGAFPNMHLLLACRRFDIEKDNRLRELASEQGPAQEITVKPFTAEEVKSALERLGCRPSEYSARQVDLLRLPLHLAIFAEVVPQMRPSALSFATSVELFAAYWDKKRAAVRDRLGGGQDDWVKVLDRLCDKMTERQTLFVPEHEVLDESERTVRVMEAEGVLVFDGHRVGFFHEGFFDYVFARMFNRLGRDLVEYLREGGQDLFKRAPMRQILLQANAADHGRFVGELRRIVLDSGIRFHLRRCAVEVATKIDQASPELWQFLQEALATDDPALIREIWRVLWAAPSWFPFLNSRGLIRDWLASPSPEQDQRALAMVNNHIHAFPAECAELLAPYVGASDQWNSSILRIIWHRQLGRHRSIFDLFLRLIEIGAVADQGHIDFWSCIYELPKTRPDWAAEALALHLRTVLGKLDLRAIEWHFLPRDGTGERVVLEVAEKAPAAFLDAVIPIFVQVVTGTAHERDGKLQIDHVWYSRMFREEALSIEDSILRGLEDAFEALAKTSVPDYTRLLDVLRPYGDYDSVNFVIVRALASAPPEFADVTVDYLLANPQRLESGWPAGGGGDFSHWAAREVIEHVAAQCSDEAFARLEKTLTTYFPHWEKTKDGQRWRGDWQLLMLTALPAARMGEESLARLGEWRRKFPGRVITPPIVSKVRFVGSPIEGDAVPRMKDADWLRALSAYDTDESSRRRPSGFLEGGAHQLSGVLESETKRDPVRFAKLSERFPTNTHRYYYHALLRGLKESTADKATVFGVVRRVFSLPTKPGHRYLCDAIAKFNAADVPEDILAIVGWCATESDDPNSDKLTVRSGGAEEENRPHDILTTAINSVRGAAAETVGTLLFDKAERLPFFMPYLQRMVQDPTVIVRTTVVYALLGMYKHDQKKAVDLFLELATTNEDALFATHHVERFLYYANFKHFTRLQPVLRRMLNSPLAVVREAGARHACLAHFASPAAKNMVEECLGGDDAKRKGAATVAEANLFNAQCSAFSHATLPTFFDDPTKGIRDEAAACFRNAQGRDLETCKPVIRAFLKSRAFAENMDDLMWPLQHSTADISDEVFLACEAVIDVMANAGSDVAGRHHGQADTVAELVLRAYRQTTDAATRARCLDLVDSLLSLEVYGMSKELEEFER